MPERRSAEEWAKGCRNHGHQEYDSCLCLPCARAYAAQETAALEAEHASYVAELKAALAQRNRESDVLRRRVGALEKIGRAIVDDLDSDNSEIHNREWWGVEPDPIKALRAALRGGET